MHNAVLQLVRHESFSSCVPSIFWNMQDMFLERTIALSPKIKFNLMMNCELLYVIGVSHQFD